MASTFPGAIDSFTDPLSNSALNSPSHSAQHADLNSAANKIETYMGLVKVIPTGATNGTVGATGTVTIGSAVASVTINGCFSSLYDNYRVLISGGAGSASTGLALRVGGITTNYSHMLFWASFGGAVNSDSLNNTGAQCNYMGATTPNGLYMSTDIMGPNLPVYTGFVGGAYIATDFGSCVGRHNIATAYTSLTVLPLSGTITGGTIRVYGYRN